MSNKQLLKKKGGHRCCVVGCNSRYSKDVGLSFYSFPSRPWEQERRKKWIIAVSRRSTTGKLWTPSKSSKICSAHFEGGRKTEHPNDNSYHPTIFPEIYKRKPPPNTNRSDRLKKRREKKEASFDINACFKESIEDTIDTDKSQPGDFIVENLSTNMNVSTQTDPDFFSLDKKESTFFCWQDSGTGEASTQCDISISKISDTKKRIIVDCKRPIENHSVKVGPDDLYRPGFMGFSDMKSDVIMKRFTGNNRAVFNVLLSFIHPGAYGQPTCFKTLNAENRLLLFLMKMKLGLDFGVLAILFQVCPQTASTIFKNVLKTIHEYTKTWVFWPSKEAIKATMPQAFKNYPNCRGIMDCAEIRCETPPTVEERVLMYSTYKSGFTIKFLIVISPSGLITFISKGYGGRATDGYIVNDSGFINLIEPGDEIMADKGFPQITTEFLQRDCILVMPPFAHNPQFTRDEVLEGYSIASVRIHVERAIQRVKTFKILKYVTHDLLDDIDKILRVACALCNCKEPIIPSE